MKYFWNVFAVLFLILFTYSFCFAEAWEEKSEFRIYYYQSSGLVFDEGYGIRDYNDAVRYMNSTLSPRNGWERFRSLCGKMVAGVTCSKFDEDTNKPGADYFCSHLSEYKDSTLKDMGESEMNAVHDLCEAHSAKPVRLVRILSQRK